ncbi:MAG: hypothetical protein AAF754_02790 [Pseudomonadota bacterium]
MRAVILGLAVCAGVMGCSRDKNVYAFDDVIFKASAKKDGETRANFTATAAPASSSVAGALQSAEYQGIRYCVNNYGTSDINWSFGPDQDLETYAPQNDTVVLTGTCAEQ